MDIPKIAELMAIYEKDCPLRTHHFIKVYGFAHIIAVGEGLQEKDMLLITALLHDSGIRTSLEKYGDAAGPHQEAEGRIIAREILQNAGITEDAFIESVCHIIGGHHTYKGIDSLEYQIIVEADFLVNFHEGEYQKEKIERVYESIFKTETGRRLCRAMYL